jgi:hypothetical protein
VKPTVRVAFEPFGPEGADLFVRPLRGRVLIGLMIRGRRAQKPCSCPRLLNLNPFGVQSRSLTCSPPCPAEDMGNDQPLAGEGARGTRAGEGARRQQRKRSHTLAYLRKSTTKSLARTGRCYTFVLLPVNKPRVMKVSKFGQTFRTTDSGLLTAYCRLPTARGRRSCRLAAKQDKSGGPEG